MVSYKSLSDAISAAGDNATITLVDNVTLTSKLNVSKNLTFDLAGYTLSGAVVISESADVTFKNGNMTAEYSSVTSNAYAVVNVTDSAALTLDGVNLAGADTVNKGAGVIGIVYQSTGELNVINSTVAGGNQIHDEGYSGGTVDADEAIYAYRESGGIINIIDSTVKGGSGKTDAVYSGSYKSGLYVNGGVALHLGGTAAVTISGSSVIGGDSDWRDAEEAVNVSNSFNGTLLIEGSSTVKGGDALNLSNENRGIGGNGIYVNQSTGCSQITVNDSEVTGGNGGRSWDGSAIELNSGTPEVVFNNSSLTVGQGVNSDGNAGAIRVNNTNNINLTLNGVTMDGAGNGNEVIKITSVIRDGGIAVAGENTIAGGTLEDVTFVEIADGTTFKTTGSGAVDAGSIGSASADLAYDDVTGEYVFVSSAVDKIVVSADWKNLPADSVVKVGENYYKIGVNAFSKMGDAAAAMTADTVNLYVAGAVHWPGSQTIDMSAAAGDTTITFENVSGARIGAYRTYIKGNGSTVVSFNNVDGECNIFMADLAEVKVDGNSQVSMTAYNNYDSQGTKTFANVGKLTVAAGSVCDFSNKNQYGFGDTVFAGAGTIKTNGTMLVAGDTTAFDGVLDIAGGVIMGSVAGSFANASTIVNNGMMVCDAAGVFTYAQNISGNGLIKTGNGAGTEIDITGDISGFTGSFDAFKDSTVKLNTRLNDVVNLSHTGGAAGVIELNGDGTPQDVAINNTSNTTTGLTVFANWNNITIQRNGKENSNVAGTIYLGGNDNAGAKDDVEVTLSAINATGGDSVGNIFFGGVNNVVSDGDDSDTNAVKVTADTKYGVLVGGGQNSTVNGDITFDIAAGAAGNEIIGAGDGNTVNGNVVINVNGGDADSVGNVFGGRSVHKVTGNININVNSGNTGNVYGIVNGFAEGTGVQDIVINVTGGVVKSIRGGNSSAGKVPAEFSARDVKINLTGGEVTGKIYGGSQLAADSITVVVDGASAADIYAGSKYAAVTATSIEVKSGSVGNIYGGGGGGAYDAAGAIGVSSVGSAAISVTGGTVNGNIYAGGVEGDNTGDAVVTISGGNVTGGVYAAGEGGIISGQAVLNFDNTSDYNSSITVINGFDSVNFNGGIVNFANVAFQNTVIKVSDVPITPGQVVTFATGNMSFDDATRFRIGDELYQLGVVGKDGYVFNYDGSGLAVEQKEVQTDTSIFYVNSEWFGMANGSVVEINGEYYSIGTNAFGNLGDALNGNCNAADDTTGTTVKLLGDISFKETTTECPDFEYALSNNLNITADNPVVIDITKPLDSGTMNYELILISKDTANPVTVTFGENVTVNTNAKIWLGRDVSAVNYVIDGSIIQTAKEEAQSGVLQIQLCEKSTAILNGSISGAQYGFQISGGTFTVSDTGKLSVGAIAIEAGRDNAHDAGMFIVDGSKNVTGAAITINETNGQRGAGYQAGASLINGAEVTLSGGVTVCDGAMITVDGGSVLNAAGDVKLGNGVAVNAGITLNMTNSSSLTAAGFTADAMVSIALDSSSIKADSFDNSGFTMLLNGSTIDAGSVTVNAGGSIMMDYTSLLAFDSLDKSGFISVISTGYTAGTYKLFDYTGEDATAVIDYKSLLSGSWNNNYMVVNNDLYITDQNNSVIYVNSAYTEYECDGYIYGYNAFSSVADAVAGSGAETAEIVIAEGTYADSGTVVFTNSVNVNANNAAFGNAWSFGINSDDANDFNMDTAAKFVVEGTLSTGAFYTEKNANVYLVLNGDLTTVGSFGAKLATQMDVNGSVTVTPPANGAAQVLVYGTMNVTGTLDSTSGAMSAVMMIGYANYDTQYGKGGVLNVTGADASVTLRNTHNDNTPVIISALSSLNVNDGASFTVERGGIENNGSVTIDNATVTLSSALNNYGTLSVTGTSVIDADMVSSGAITVDSALLTTNSIANSGNMTITWDSTVTFSEFTNSGTITIDWTDFNEVGRLLLDCADNSWTVDDYKALLGAAWDDAKFTVSNGDLWLKSTVVYVNTEYGEGLDNDGHLWGINAFADIESAKAAAPESIVITGGEITDTAALEGCVGVIKDGVFGNYLYAGNGNLDATGSGDSVLVIEGGTFNRVYGGNRIEADFAVNSGDITLNISGGEFNSVVSGSGHVTSGYARRSGEINVSISGGTFHTTVAGGICLETNEVYDVVYTIGSINFEISGGTFEYHIYGGNVSAKAARSSQTFVDGDINLTIDASQNAVNIIDGCNVVAGSSGYGTVVGNVNVTIKGDKLNFNGILSGGSEGAHYYIGADGSRTCNSYIDGTRSVTFSNFNGNFDGRIVVFENISFVDNSNVVFTNTGLSLSDISEWNFEFGSSVSGLNSNDFTGDTMNLDLTGWDQLSSWDVMDGTGSAFSGLNDLASVTIGGQAASWDDSLSSWCSSDYQLGIREEDGKEVMFVSKLA